MAIETLCGKLLTGQDLACKPLTRKYYQQVVVINRNDIDAFDINTTDFDATNPTCAYNVEFALKEGTSGKRFLLPQNGSSVFGTHDKATDDNGNVIYTHNVNMFVAGADEESKCIQEALDKGSYVVALQLMDGTVEIYGIENGISTGDYTYDIQANGGGTAIVLSSREDSPENFKPLVYKPADGGDANADFNELFVNS